MALEKQIASKGSNGMDGLLLKLESVDKILRDKLDPDQYRDEIQPFIEWMFYRVRKADLRVTEESYYSYTSPERIAMLFAEDHGYKIFF